MPKAEIASLDKEFAELSKAIEAEEAKGRKFDPSGSDREESISPTSDEAPKKTADAEKAPEIKDEPGQERSEITPEKDDGEEGKVKSKDEERYDRNWKEFQKEKDSFRSERDQIRKELAELREQKQREAQKIPDTPADDKGFTAEQYEKHAQACEDNEDYRTAHWARQTAAKLRSDHMMKVFMAQWRENYDAAAKDNPDMANLQSDFYKEVDETVKNNESFQRSPKGILTAVEYVKHKRQSGLVSDLQTENEKLKKEITRLNELSAPGGGGVNRTPSDKSFDDMSTDEMYKHLMRQERERERERAY